MELAIDGAYRSAQLSADGQRLLLAARNSVDLWKLNPLTRLQQVKRARIQDVSASASLDVAVVATERIALDLVRFAQPDQPCLLRGTARAQRVVATSPDGRWVVTVQDFIDHDGTVWLWSLSGASPPRAIDRHTHMRGASKVIVARDGDTLVSLSSDALRVASAAGRSPATEVKPASWSTFDATDIAVSDDGNLICLGSDARLAIVDRRTGQMLRDLTDTSRKIDRVVTSGDGRIALVSGTSGVVELVDIEGSKDLTKLIADEEKSWFAHGVTDISLDANATRAAVVTQDACRIYALDWERELTSRRA
jgi:WD40 repeat protein